MVDARTAVIVGASRGLGLGLAQRFLERDWVVWGTVRDPARADALQAAGAANPGGKLQITAADIEDDVSIRALAAALDGRTLDLLVVNPAIWGPGEVAIGDLQEISRAFHVNATGPARAAYTLLDRMRPDTGVVAFMTSRMGSIADDSTGGSEVYRASKAAQNAYARAFHVRAAAPKGLTTLSLHPGWVKTDMGGPNAPLNVEASTRGLADVCEAAAGRRDHRFVQYDGREIPW
jgi:NAD(P)-dependent dehydrogenase (short-subunit alcohol dehydrogenase family)